MKLKYENSNLIIIIICIISIVFFTCINVIYNDNIFSITFIILIIFTFFLVVMDFYDRKKYKKMKKGIKKQGYIIGVFYRIPGHKANTYGLKILLENQIYYISYVSNNKAYKRIINDLKNVSVESAGIFRLRKIPVDIYIDGDEYFADLDSVKLD